ncbi:Terminal uridylyltransferase Tailor [Frankliniella fusca]|uniref:Terminal uridylyltransferase Tailor n=1 Tax=Frankliniella fusca TaxID=407009 RepID=A0AAE1H0D4_9NEOP|nr:Terminal uridylyltransferase Tailor [Frankliniella fusca]
MSRFCEPCGITVQEDNFKSHIEGKKHKLQEAKLQHKMKLEETGLYIRGIPNGIKAPELRNIFQQFGDISVINVFGSKAYLYFVDKLSCDEALKHKHVAKNQVLVVNRRKLTLTPPGSMGSGGSGQGLKRGFDNIQNNIKLETPAKRSLDCNKILEAIASPAPITHHFSTLKNLLLAGDEGCQLVIRKICSDLEFSLRTTFNVRKLYPFGSMTTGLAFKDSDLDLFADLEINESKCLLLEDNKNLEKKIFDKAKSCFYRRGNIFTGVVPIARAKTPIIKFIHKATSISCDLSFKDAVGYCNSRLLRQYLQMNERFFELIFFIKYWSRMHQFCSTSKFSNFALSMLGLSFLLSLKDAKGNNVVPPVQELLNTADQNDPHYFVQGWRCAFNTSPITIDLPNTPYFTMPGLLRNFFEYVSHLPFETHVISVLTGQLIERKIFAENPSELPEAYECYRNHIARNPTDSLFKPDECVVIHDPFKLNHNLTGRVTNDVLKSFTEACRTAAELCSSVLDDNNLQSTLLHKLLNPNQHLLNKPNSQAQPSTAKGNVSSSKAMMSITLKMPEAFQENPLENSTNFLSAILQEILHFKIKNVLSSNDVIPSKIGRTDCMQDVHEENLTVLVCQGTKDVWNGRKKAQAFLKAKGTSFQNPLSFNDEKCISTHLAENNIIISDLALECRLICSKEKLNVQFQNEGKQGYFNSCMSFVNIVLHRWVAEFSKTFLQKSESQNNPIENQG